MRVLVTGGTGFTGRYVVRRLAEAGHRVNALVREQSPRHAIEGLVDSFSVGDLSDTASLGRALQGQDALVNVASIGFGHAAGIVQAAQAASVGRAVYFSTTSLFTTLPASSKSVRQEAENQIRSSSTAWTIIRPTMIYGDPGDRNLIRLIRWVDRWRVVPVFGPGTYQLQPVHADDLAQAIVTILERNSTMGREYNLSGGTALTYNELVGLVGELVGHRPKLIHLPLSASLLAVDLVRRFPKAPKFTREQVLRLNEHKAFSHEAASRDFGYAPRALRDGLSEEVRLYRERRG